MADIKISQLTAKGTAIAATDLIEISESNGAGGFVTKSVTGANILASAGNVVGASSSTDNAITRFDSTTGKLLQNSLVTVADDGAITAPQVGSVIPFYYANQAAFPSASTYHGALAHSHSDGAMFFAHGGAWVRILDNGVASGTPSLVAGTNINITGTFPNQTINATGTAGAVTQLIAGTNITLSPAGGTGVVTVNSSGGGGGGGTEIGALIGGGIVVAVFVEGGVNKALVASLTNLSLGLIWTIAAFQTTSIGATAQSISDGLGNTNAIIAQTGASATTAYAAGLARLFAGGGYGDWYLPSKNELVVLYNSTVIINRVLGATNGITQTGYWSSTENSASSVWNINPAFGTFDNTAGKNFSRNVRAVRIHTI